jgi:hypothetical protein
MDILTLELYDVTVSEALREINRVLEAHPDLPLRILAGGEEMLVHNIQRFLERTGRGAKIQRDGARWRIETGPIGPAAPPQPEPRLHPAAPPPRVIPAQAAPRPLLLTRAALGSGSGGSGRRLLLGLLRELEPQVPWVGLALDATGLLEDPEALAVFQALEARGTRVRVSRDGLLFPDEPESAFGVIEDSEWQRLAGRGDLIIL